MRDDFTKPVSRELAKRVGHRCSNPKCRKLTSGPHSDPAKSVNTGVAAHITAASPGGPRFDASMTPRQRQEISNGIWLCQGCAKLVDSDIGRYSIQVLNEWKEISEHDARIEIGSSTHARPAGDGAGSDWLRFVAEDWNMWKERGNLPGDSFVVISGWGRGDARYSFKIRLRNERNFEEQLTNVRVELRLRDEVVLSDEFAIQPDEITLPPRKWVTREVSYGVHDKAIFERARSVWVSADLLGGDERFQWHIAEYDPSDVKPPRN